MSYWSEWRDAHPEYRQREVERKRLRRAISGRGDRTVEYARQRERRAAAVRRVAGDTGWTVTTHPVLDAARAVALRHLRPDRRSVLGRPTYEDCVGEAVVALLAGADPDTAVHMFLMSDQAWLWHTAPLYDWSR